MVQVFSIPLIIDRFSLWLALCARGQPPLLDCLESVCRHREIRPQTSFLSQNMFSLGMSEAIETNKQTNKRYLSLNNNNSESEVRSQKSEVRSQE
jgi:hypothetical protein